MINSGEHLMAALVLWIFASCIHIVIMLLTGGWGDEDFPEPGVYPKFLGCSSASDVMDYLEELHLYGIPKPKLTQAEMHTINNAPTCELVQWIQHKKKKQAAFKIMTKFTELEREKQATKHAGLASVEDNSSWYVVLVTYTLPQFDILFLVFLQKSQYSLLQNRKRKWQK